MNVNILLMKVLALFLLIIATNKTSAQAPSWLWAKKAGGSLNELVAGIAVDSNGNSYVTGLFYSSILNFGGTALSNMGDMDMYVAKYDAAGNVVWAKSAGGSNHDAGIGITADDSGNVYVTGVFQSASIAFGSTTLINTNVMFNDIFIVKYDVSGNVVWAKSEGGSGADYGNSISVDDNYNVLVTGDYYSPSLTFGATTLLNSGGNNDIFTAKYDASGSVLWAKGAGGNEREWATSNAVDTSGNTYVTGKFFSASLTFGSTTLLNNGEYDVFIAKYDTSGNVLWAKGAGGNLNDEANSLEVDGSGYVYLTGEFFSPVLSFDTITLANSSPGIFDAFIIKLDASGNVIWGNSEGGNQTDFGNSIAVDGIGNVYMSGTFNSTNLVIGSTSLLNSGAYDIYIVMYDSSGNVQWAKRVGGSEYDYNNHIALDGSGNAILAGSFASPSLAFGTINLTNIGLTDFFIAKLGQVVGEDENAPSMKIALFPNPYTSQSVLQTDVILKNATLRMDDVFGQQVVRMENLSGNSIALYRNNLPAGMYVLRLIENNKILTTHKLIVTD